jgi:hypothetical protein
MALHPVNYSPAGLVFDMGTRERKTNINYDIDGVYKREGGRGGNQSTTKRGRKLVMPEHQFFDREKCVIFLCT